MNQIPFFNLSLDSEETDRYIQIIKKHMISGKFIMGESVETAEDCFSKRFGKSAKLVSSGTSACYLALKTLNIPKGKKILTSPITWIATSNAIVENGLVPKFLPLDRQTLNIDVNKIEEYIDKEVAGVSIVHHAGIPMDHKRISDICKKHKIKFVEDCAQAFGSEYEGEHVGKYSDIATFSFNPMKQLGCILDLGLILYPAQFEQRIRSLRHNGTPDKKIFNLTSLNFKPDAIAAAVILEKLNDWDKHIYNHLQKLMNVYIKSLKKSELIVLPQSIKTCNSILISPYTFPIILRNKSLCMDLHNQLKKRGIETKIKAPYVPDYEIMQDYKSNRGKEESSLCEMVLYLPLYKNMNVEEVECITKEIQEYLKFEP